MGDDVNVSLAQLEVAYHALEDIVQEFEDAQKNSEELEGAIGDPFGRGDLREKAEEFEERWDDKRGELKDSLDEIKEHVKAVVDTMKQWDVDTTNALSG